VLLSGSKMLRYPMNQHRADKTRTALTCAVIPGRSRLELRLFVRVYDLRCVE
jgi:hypothetical protein